MALGTGKRNARKQVEYTGLKIVEQPMCGPVAGRTVRCLVCHKVICSGELWRRIYAADGSYSVAVHNGCRMMPESQAEHDALARSAEGR